MIPVTATDPDANQNITINVVQKPENATFYANQLKWTPVLNDTGSFTVIFTATDNGTPALSTTDTCIIIVTSTLVNRAPKWSITSIQRSTQPEILFSFDVSSYCSDPDNDNLTFSLLPQAPAKDSITGKLYQLTPAISDTGVYSISVVATDPSGLSDTFKLELTISKAIISKPDLVPPVIVLKSPLKDTVITADSFEVTVTCVDDSGCSVKGYRDGVAFDMKKSSSGANFWTGMAKGITAGIYSTIKIVAEDSSAAKNRDSVSVKIKYDGDMSKPVLTRVTPAVENVSTNSSSYTITIACSDSCGVLSVNAILGSKSFAGARGTDNNWTIPVTGLVSGAANAVVVTAVDSSIRANTSTLNYAITFDPTMLDTIGPTITPVNGPSSGTTVTTSAVDIIVSVSDPSDVDSVYWTKNNGTKKVMTPVTGKAGQYSLNETLTEGKIDTLTLVAVDKASRHNQTKLTITLKYSEPRYSVSYNGNYNSGGTVPSDAGTYTEGTTVTVAVAEKLVRTGYSFTGWNTAANGSGTARAAGSTFEMGSENVTLYAQWKLIPTYTVEYNGNGNTGGTIPNDPGTYVQGTKVTVSSAGSLVRSGYSFTGWNTESNGSGTARAAGSTFEIGSASVILFAQWKMIPTYTVTYNGNYNTGGTAPNEPGTYVQGATVTVATAGTLVRNGYSFAGWNTEANGSGTARAAGSTFEMGSASVTLYAQWQKIRYLVTFKNNISTQTNTEYYDAGSTISSSQYPGFTIGGYELSYWDKTSITVNSAMTVTAYYVAIDCAASANDVTIWSETGETFNLIVTANTSSCKITKYAWYWANGVYTYISDGKNDQGLFTSSGQTTNTLVVNKVIGGAYGILCIVTFENGQQDTVSWPLRYKPKVVYSPGDGSGIMDDQSFTPGESFRLNPCTFTRTGYRFTGWCLDAECTMGPAFGDQTRVTFGEDSVYLIASWVEE